MHSEDDVELPIVIAAPQEPIQETTSREVRSKPVTSSTSRKLCFFFNQRTGCKHGTKCSWAHVMATPEERMHMRRPVAHSRTRQPSPPRLRQRYADKPRTMPEIHHRSQSTTALDPSAFLALWASWMSSQSQSSAYRSRSERRSRSRSPRDRRHHHRR